MKGQEAINLWKLGDKKWNAWVKKNPDADIDFSSTVFSDHVKNDVISFQHYTFPTGMVSFNDASFSGRVSFDDANFSGDASFDNAKFTGVVSFDYAQFSGKEISFYGAEFNGKVISFKHTKFSENVSFCDAQFSGKNIDFSNVEFNGEDTSFDNIKFSGQVSFNSAKFSGNISYGDANFSGEASFGNAKFSGEDTYFGNVRFNGRTTSFGKAQFSGKRAYFDCVEFNGEEAFFNSVDFNGEMISFQGTELNGKGYFTNSTFRGKHTSFSRVKFSGEVFFDNARFSGEKANFDNGEFNGKTTSFDNAMFSGDIVSFRNTQFRGEIICFDNAEFEQSLSLQNAGFTDSIKVFSFRYSIFSKNLTLPILKLNCVLDLRNTKFNTQMMLHDLKCTLQTKTKRWRIIQFQIAADIEDISRLRRLKEISESNKNHEGALEFHADEMRAKRWHTSGRLASILDLMFDKISNYGQNILKSFFFLLFSNICFSLLYFVMNMCMAFIHNPGCNVRTEGRFWDALDITFYNSIPFVPITRTIGAAGIENLFGDDIPNWFGIAASSQGLISIVCLFLVGLGLRNRFRI
ncbi:MAG: pentapeptide repeat-containing protein [Halopseudomonas aestusnigri]